MAKSVRWDLIADPKGFQRGFREANRSADTFSRGIKRTAGLIGGAFAGIQVAGFLKDAILEAREAAKVTRQTNAVIKATGGVANVSAKDVDRLANSLMAKVGVDDEVIAAGQNMLLTFKGVRNEVGKGNDIFNQTTKVALDMTAALNQGEISQSGLEKTTMRLGKALNDPIKGISALTRAGVTFTVSQKEQIKTLVESGDTMAAQRIILKELTSEFGGAAAAAADPWQRMTVVLENVKEEIGTALLPAFESAADWLSVALPAAIDRTKAALRDAKAWWDSNKDSVKTLATILVDTFVPASDDSNQSIKDFTTSLGTLKNFLTDVAVFSLELVKVWLTLEHVTIGMISVFADMNKVLGHAINAVQFLTTGTKGAGDEFVRFGDDLKRQATAELKEVRKQADNAQEAIDRLHGKDVKITGTTSLQFTKTFTQKDWVNARLAAGRIATGGPIHGPGTETSDSIPMWLSKGEHVWSAREVKGAGGHAAMESMRIQARGLALGGKVDQTGTAHTGVGRMMDRWGTLRLAALVKESVGFGGPGIQNALRWARTQVGHPYVWGGVGPGGYDCSGFMSAIANVVMGRSPHHRLFATGSFPTSGWSSGFMQSGFSIGSRRGNPGHMAGTLGGVNVESRGSRGVVVGTGARGAQDSLFGGNVWHMSGRSSAAGGQESPRAAINPRAFDRGGWLPPGLSMAYNGTGRPERVSPPGRGGGDIHVHLHGDVYGDTNALVNKVREGIRDAQRRGGVPAGQQIR